MGRIKPGFQVEENGVRIDIHMVKDDHVYFQRWPVGIMDQGVFDNLYRMPVAEFERQVALDV